jgi:DNA invertase Pin-like site-specific DNA recombinase
LQELDELGVAFVSLKDNIDLSTSAGRLMMHMLGAFAQFEADLIRERVRAGVKRAREKGKRLGRPCVTETAKVIDLRKNGHSIREIARQLGVSRGAIERAIRT